MRIEPAVIFDEKFGEQHVLDRAFNSYRILGGYTDLLEHLRNVDDEFRNKERKIDSIVVPLELDVIGRIGSSISGGGEILPRRLRMGIAVLKVLREACERDKKIDYGGPEFDFVISEARDEQIRAIDAGLAILKTALESVFQIEDDIKRLNVFY